MSTFILVGARVLAGGLAGIYLAFLLAVMPALHNEPDDVYAQVMNRINTVIVNPGFMLFFLGSPLFALVLLYWHRGPIGYSAAGLAVVTLAITVVVNVPLNNALAAGGAVSSFETPWMIAHVVRTIAGSVACVLLCLPDVASE